MTGKLLCRLTAISLLALSSPACALFTPPLTSPANGGAAWTELGSPHFTVRTDASPATGRWAIQNLEQIYTTFKDVAFPSDKDPLDHIDVVLFNREQDYKVVAPPLSSAYFTEHLPGDLEGAPTMVVNGNLDRGAWITLQHELAHHMLHQALGGMPPWLNEGMAQFYSTLRADNGKVFVGEPLPDIGFVSGSKFRAVRGRNGGSQLLVPFEALPSVEALLEMEREDFYRRSKEGTNEDKHEQTAHYAGAWALVHMLHNGAPEYRDRFSAFISRVQGGEMLKVAWRNSFDDINPEGFQMDFLNYLKQPEMIIHVIANTPTTARPPDSEQAMSDAQVHLLWSRLRSWEEGSVERVRRELEAALVSDPTNPDVHFERALFASRTARPDEAEREIEVALASKPEEPRYLLAQAEFLQRGLPAQKLPSPRFEQVEKIMERLGKLAHTATELNHVGWFYAELGRGDAGLSFGERAVEKDPTCWECLDTYALLLSLKGRFEEALAMQARALNLMPETASGAGLMKRLHKYSVVVRARARRKQREQQAKPEEKPEREDDEGAPPLGHP